ncbi:hypothetical protein GQF01_11455 [Paenibacillus sp. 5J-6]|uniref:Uncharacterized protein n=1 Tax=Paenibacillus silvestris TaxID=2606219 RepID=A0A6L8UXR2_9BACL|nr:hypothetical protein [Paenibacillus silvestris]MZQ82717.1 hypothetical protein [Paenibacillus silvestris]
MAERQSGKKLNAIELILNQLKETFNRNELECNIWLMAVAVVSFRESTALPSWIPSHSVERPSHQARVVVRTSTSEGDNPYVDGSDFFFVVNLESQTVEFVWAEECLGYSPEYHGGTIEAAIAWARLVSEPCLVRLDDPYR